MSEQKVGSAWCEAHGRFNSDELCPECFPGGKRFVALDEGEIERLIALCEYEMQDHLARKLRAVLKQPEGVSEEWRAVVGDKGDLLLDVCEPRSTREEAQGDLEGLSAKADPPFDYGHVEHRYCTPWAALHREDGEG